MHEPDLDPDENAKDGKALRKRLQKTDRSKFKLTDRKKFESDRDAEIAKKAIKATSRGRILSIRPQNAIVDCEGQLYSCSAKGLMKRDKTQDHNLYTVGDFVWFEPLADFKGLIGRIEERKSVLSRADNLSRNKQQLIAANIDQVIITASLHAPSLKPTLIDRYIIAAEQGRMEPVIVINKIDLLPECTEEEVFLFEESQQIYKDLGIPIILLSTQTGEGLDALKDIMKGKASVFSGQSGVGKSSLINAMTGLELATGETVEATRKGAHTTTTANLIPLTCGGFVIDTPGIKSFGLWDIQYQDLVGYFTEIFEKGRECHYPACTHEHEPECAVKEAVEEGEISSLRYISYLSLLEKCKEAHKRR